MVSRRVHRGAIRLRGRDIATLSQRALRPMRRDLQMVFQNPYVSLNSHKRGVTDR
jgi:peptide/nickel transport system ATP-binding protein